MLSYDECYQESKEEKLLILKMLIVDAMKRGSDRIWVESFFDDILCLLVGFRITREDEDIIIHWGNGDE
jgi:hypothetical protein